LTVDGNATQPAIDPPSSSLGRLVRALRERALLTQEELAARSGISVGTIAGLESGRTRRPRSVSVWLLADALGLSAEDRAALRTAAGGEEVPRRDRAAAVPVVVPAQLPPDLAEFTGREPYVKRLDELLPAGLESRPASVVISAIGGTAGIGKTTLAVHWAHRVAGQFPDGQLYVNLRGFGGGAAVEPTEAVRGFLEALGVPPDRIPASLDGQVGLYRSLLAGRRMLIVLDNARDSEQVRPLLPGSPGCLVIVTSRNLLAGLVASDGAQPLRLDLPSRDEARRLLERRLGRERIEPEADAVDDIIASCARLPLGLAIVAARAATHPAFPLRALAAQLRESAGGLDAFASGDAATDLRVVLSWSYQHLSESAARLFRLLGLSAGPDIAAPAAASLAGIAPALARSLLTELARAQLLTEHAPGRYSFHDLLRAYAAELAGDHDPEPDRRAALGRLLDHYLHACYAAARLLTPHRERFAPAGPADGVTLEKFGEYGQALGWCVAEHRVLLATVALAGREGLDRHVVGLAWAAEPFLDRRGYWHDSIGIQSAALAAAGRLGERAAIAQAHAEIARPYGRIGRYDDAERHLRQALELHRELGDEVRQASDHIGLSWVQQGRGSHREAIPHGLEALALYRSASRRNGQASALNSVGWNHALLGDHQLAHDYCQQALAIHQETGDRSGAANTWDSLGYIHRQLGEYQHAVDCYRQALAGYRALGNRYLEADSLIHLGDTYQAAGERDAAWDAWQQALAILDELSHPAAEPLRRRLGSGVTAEPERGDGGG
jgi:tetratricopeptide (TPR) repeat protein/transcriptional regulator with XRE-family HTH domain